MNPFNNIRIFPQHGATTARITWEVAPGFTAGEVYAAFSFTGVKGSWIPVNSAPIPSSLGQIDDYELRLDGGHHIGYYRLLLRNVDGDFRSDATAILGDLTSKEYGIARSIIRREFLEMRATNGYPVWYCIPRDFGTPASNIDPDTHSAHGSECGDLSPEEASYGLPFKGGFFPPILTWMRPMVIDRGTIKDGDDETSPKAKDETTARLLAFPRPQRQHMIVDPATDRRYVVMDEVKPFMLRGIIPIAYEVTLDFILQNDPRYKFPVPDIDMREYRRIKNWW